MDGYQLARQLGHHRTALYPSLVQVCTDPTYPRGLKGVKAQAALTLTREGETLTAGQGEVLFTEYGVSGPAVFDLSRQISTGGDGIALHLDFLPGWSREDTLAWLHSRRTALSRQEAGALLTGQRPSPAGTGAVQGGGHQRRRGDIGGNGPPAGGALPPGAGPCPARHRHLRL